MTHFSTRRAPFAVTFLAVLASGGFAGIVSSAHASEEIGVAVTVRNEVTGKIQSQTVSVSNGSNVFGKEIVRTNADSSAKIVLKDSTNLNVGPSSSVTLDNFVFKGDSDYKQAAIGLAKGAFRFTSGGSDKRAYDIKTPAATIGVRGTDFAAVVGADSTHIEVTEGRILVCPRRKKANEAETGGSADSGADPAAQFQGRASQSASNGKIQKLPNGCAYVNEGQSVDVNQNSVTQSNFSGQASQMACGGACSAPQSYASAMESASLGSTVGGIPIQVLGVAGVGAGAAAGAAVAATNNANQEQKYKDQLSQIFRPTPPPEGTSNR
jgi:hypothetical protein